MSITHKEKGVIGYGGGEEGKAVFAFYLYYM